MVVPAHDEAARIGRCVTAIDQAARHPALVGVLVEVIVVLDRCTDSTGDRALASRKRTLTTEVNHGSVGAARAAGMELALQRTVGAELACIWLATTDADSVVPPGWLAHQVALRNHKFEAVAGTVRVRSWADQPRLTPALHDGGYRAKGGHRYGHHHVHGANLAFSADAYVQAGGFPQVATAEDHLLWTALVTGGTPVVATPEIPVWTSARREGRAPGGFAAFLRTLDGTPPRGQDWSDRRSVARDRAR